MYITTVTDNTAHPPSITNMETQCSDVLTNEKVPNANKYAPSQLISQGILDVQNVKRCSTAHSGELNTIPLPAGGRSQLERVATGLDATHHTGERSLREARSALLRKYRFRVYLLALTACLLVNVPLGLIPAVLLASQSSGANDECHPYKAVLVTCMTLCFVINLAVLTFYGCLVYKYRDEPFVKAKSVWYLIQIFVLGALVMIAATWLLGAMYGYWGDLPCYIYYYISHQPGEFDLDLLPDGIFYGLVALRLCENIYIGAAVARQRVLYLLFGESGDAIPTRPLSKIYLQRQYIMTVILLACVALIVEIPYIIHSSQMDGYDLVLFGSKTSWYLLLYWLYAVIVICLPLAYYSWRTRKIDAYFSDRDNNIRIVVTYFIANSVHYSLSLKALQEPTWTMYIYSYTIMFICPTAVFLVTLYITTSFTTELLLCSGLLDGVNSANNLAEGVRKDHMSMLRSIPTNFHTHTSNHGTRALSSEVSSGRAIRIGSSASFQTRFNSSGVNSVEHITKTCVEDLEAHLTEAGRNPLHVSKSIAELSSPIEGDPAAANDNEEVDAEEILEV